ncbi:MAG: AAA family ATPase [Candidatus Helarchaeota archaeon]|nr:AAA family ATPase [Candidatus Helarchaeota archaeon]
MLITISGFHGTGKTTIAKEIEREFNLRYIAAGDIFRQMAKDRRMTLEEFSQFVEQNPEIDREIDNRTIEEAKKGDVILDGLLAAWITRDIPAINVLLFAGEEVRINRITQREERTYEEVKEETLGREKSEIARFKKEYDINLNDHSIYDIVLNTGLWSEESMTRIIIMLIKEHLKFVQK